MIVHSVSQLLTLSPSPQRGHSLGNLGILVDAAIVLNDGVIIEYGPNAEMMAKYTDEAKIDAHNQVVMPGFVDAHTHVVWAGDRAAEFEMRLEGKTYLEILEAGGGILSTVTNTRKASLDQLIVQTRLRLKKMLQHGTTTVEAKTGYGLDTQTELQMLAALTALDHEGPWDLILTFLGAHAIPPEYDNDPDGYVELLCTEMLPAVKSWWNENIGGQTLPFADVFCETGAFSLTQSKKILVTAKALGFPLKIHADEFDNLGGTKMAAELGALSADHLVAASAADIKALAESNTVAVALPGTPFGLASSDYAPAQKIIDAGGILAVASDLNPGTSWCENMQMAIALACRYMKLTPAQAIAAATINGAAAVGQSEKLGSLTVGKQADMLILSVNNYRHIGYQYGTNLVNTVIKKGEIVVQN